jgi:hypothetical protein
MAQQLKSRKNFRSIKKPRCCWNCQHIWTSRSFWGCHRESEFKVSLAQGDLRPDSYVCDRWTPDGVP